MFTFTVDENIKLRLLEKRNAEEMIQAVNESRSYLREWLPWVDNMVTAEDYHPVIQMWLEQFAKNDGFEVAIQFKGKLVGMVGFHGIDWKDQKTEIGYWLAEGYQGNGIMTKVVKALVTYAFDELGLNRVVIQCAFDNRKSRAIPERLGFNQEGIMRDGQFLYDRFHDLVVYGMLARDWKK